MPSLRLLLAAREDRDDALAARLGSEVERAVARLGEGASARALTRVRNDSFAAQYPEPRAFEGVLDVTLAGARGVDRLLDIARGADERFSDVAHCDLSGALVGERRRIQGDESALRFLYLMRHKAGLTTESYQEHWGGPHAEFGRRTRGITGYDQLHVDPAASRAAARIAGFGVHRIDGVAELHMQSLDEFTKATRGSTVGREAILDEKGFVDRRNSVGFLCSVVARA